MTKKVQPLRQLQGQKLLQMAFWYTILKNFIAVIPIFPIQETSKVKLLLKESLNLLANDSIAILVLISSTSRRIETSPDVFGISSILRISPDIRWETQAVHLRFLAQGKPFYVTSCSSL